MEDEKELNNRRLGALCGMNPYKNTMENKTPLDKRMYNINAQISFIYVAKQKSMPIEEVMRLNKLIGEWIKEIREKMEKEK